MYTASTRISTLSLHDALPISRAALVVVSEPGRPGADDRGGRLRAGPAAPPRLHAARLGTAAAARSEEHTSELQSHSDLVCRLLPEKKKKPNHPARENVDRPHP